MITKKPIRFKNRRRACCNKSTINENEKNIEFIEKREEEEKQEHFSPPAHPPAIRSRNMGYY